MNIFSILRAHIIQNCQPQRFTEVNLEKKKKTCMSSTGFIKLKLIWPPLICKLFLLQVMISEDNNHRGGCILLIQFYM